MIPSITIDKTRNGYGEDILWTGSGFTPNGKVKGAISTSNAGPVIYAWEFTADGTGQASGKFTLGTNIPQGPQKFYVLDEATQTLSNAVQIEVNGTQPPPPGRQYVKIHETSHWRWWTTQDFWNQHQNEVSTFFDYPESYLSRLREDFGYDVPKILDLVLDPDSHGGATGSAFGPYGITIAADSVYNEAWGVKGFWSYVLSLHETINVWTGHLTSGWPWANGSEIWHGGSQFPNMADIVVTKELGLNDVSQIQAQRMLSDPGVRLLYDLQQQFGWRIYQSLFSLIRQYRVDFATYAEPTKTATIVLFLSSSAGTSLLPLFRQAGVGAPDDALRVVQQLFPAIKIS